MAAPAGYFDRKPSTSIRPRLSHLQKSPGTPTSPHTPQRTFSSAFSSPSLSYRAEEDSLVFELGARHFRAGFAGESSPRCTTAFGPEDSRRVGDFRSWTPNYEPRRRIPGGWGEDHELWRMDLRTVDLGLVEDKVERAVREAFSKYLLLDNRSRRILLVLPPVMPHPLLSSVLAALFINFQNPYITVLPTHNLNVVAAGCRSGLVVDIGWSETVITALYEYREVGHRRTNRAMKKVSLAMAKILRQYAGDDKQHSTDPESSDDIPGPQLDAYFEKAEEATIRMAWCQSYEEAHGSSDLRLSDLHIAEDERLGTEPSSPSGDPTMSIHSPLGPSKALHIPFTAFSFPIETSLLPSPPDNYTFDDHEQSLPSLIYQALLTLSYDVRSICMSRIIITGGGSNIPGLKTRLLDELSSLIRKRNWDPVYGKATDERRKRLAELSRIRRTAAPKDNVQKAGKHTDVQPKISVSPQSAADVPQIPDPIEEKLRRDDTQGIKSSPLGAVRGIETLGAWAGASLVAGLKIKGMTEVERDSFLQYGLAGARRDGVPSIVPQSRAQSYGPGMARVGERGNWTLGAWA